MSNTDTPTPRLRAAIYARISLDKKDGAGVERQQQDALSLAELHKLDVDPRHIYVDNSISAYHDVERPGYEALLSAIEHEEVDRVICWHTDRLHRNTRQLLDYLDLCKVHGVKTLAVQGNGLDPDSSDGRFLATVLGAVAEQESSHRSDRIRRAALQRAEQGVPRRSGRRVFGYEKDGETLRESEARWLRDAARRLLAGEALRSIATEMYNAGVKTTGGREMTPGALRDTLRTPYIGGLSSWCPRRPDGRLVKSDRVILGPGQWPGVLDADTWHAVNDLLSNPNRRTNRVGNTPRHLLSGVAKCGICGGPMWSGTVGGRGQKRRRMYRCVTPGGVHVTRMAENVDRYVSAYVLDLLQRMDIGAYLAAHDTEDGTTAALVTERDQLTARLDDLENQLSSAAGPAVPVVMRSVTRVADDLDAVTKRLAGTADSGSSALTRVIGVENLTDWWTTTATIDERRELVRETVEVTILKAPAGTKGFHPEYLRLESKV